MRAGIIIVVAAAVTAMIWYWHAHRPHTYRYKLTVEVETPAGLRTGAAIREFVWSPTPRSFTGNRFSSRQRGEAVAVDLPGGDSLFALLDVNGYDTLLSGFGPASTLELKPLLDRVAADREVHAYPPRDVLRARHLDWPPLVRFRDLDDPRTVEIVDPGNLEASFGPGVRLRRMTVQMTDEPVTQSLRTRLRWLRTVPEARLDPDFRGGSNPDLAQRLAHGEFYRER